MHYVIFKLISPYVFIAYIFGVNEKERQDRRNPRISDTAADCIKELLTYIMGLQRCRTDVIASDDK
jgi:hypothetical protein